MTTTPTQTEHPWRATARTVVAVGLATATAIPYVEPIVQGVVDGWGVVGVLGQVTAVAGALTRIFALPQVNTVLELIGLGATPLPKNESSNAA